MSIHFWWTPRCAVWVYRFCFHFFFLLSSFWHVWIPSGWKCKNHTIPTSDWKIIELIIKKSNNFAENWLETTFKLGQLHPYTPFSIIGYAQNMRHTHTLSISLHYWRKYTHDTWNWNVIKWGRRYQSLVSSCCELVVCKQILYLMCVSTRQVSNIKLNLIFTKCHSADAIWFNIITSFSLAFSTSFPLSHTHTHSLINICWCVLPKGWCDVI